MSSIWYQAMQAEWSSALLSGVSFVLRWQPNAVLRGNLIFGVHCCPHAHGGAPNNGIFFGQGSSAFLIEESVIYRTSGDPVRFHQWQVEWQTWNYNVFRIPPGDAGFSHDKSD